jgi:hypothetical protein
MCSDENASPTNTVLIDENNLLDERFVHQATAFIHVTGKTVRHQYDSVLGNRL